MMCISPIHFNVSDPVPSIIYPTGLPVQMPSKQSSSFYTHWGIPLLGIWPPILPEERNKIQSQRYLFPFRVSQSQRIVPIDPDAKNDQDHARENPYVKQALPEYSSHHMTPVTKIFSKEPEGKDLEEKKSESSLSQVYPIATRHRRIGSL